MAGSETRSVKNPCDCQLQRSSRLIFAAVLLICSGAVFSQALYKYQAEDGSWIYSDRPPPDEREAEVRDLPTGANAPTVSVTTRLVERRLQLTAHNQYYVPVEIILALDELRNVELPPPDMDMRWLVPARSRLDLLQLPAIADNLVPEIKFRHIWLPGDPASEHNPQQPYRAPFAVANDFPISQAYPMAATHNTPDSRHAVDIAMPIDTDVNAARAGIVFEFARTNFRGGMEAEQFAASANLVRIMHDDGTHAVYAHLNWNTIRVRPGDRVERGEYIADSGNTGFSSGPHLHFAVLKNLGLRIEALPVVFAGPDTDEIPPAAGNVLTAY